MNAWLPWLANGILAGMLMTCAWANRRMADALMIMQRRFADEKAAHFVTYSRLQRRERKLGALLKQVEAMAEIAQSSAQLAQIYEPLMAEARGWADSTPAGL